MIGRIGRQRRRWHLVEYTGTAIRGLPGVGTGAAHEPYLGPWSRMVAPTKFEPCLKKGQAALGRGAGCAGESGPGRRSLEAGCGTATLAGRWLRTATLARAVIELGA